MINFYKRYIVVGNCFGSMLQHYPNRNHIWLEDLPNIMIMGLPRMVRNIVKNLYSHFLFSEKFIILL